MLRCNHSLFGIRWPVLLAKAIGQQDFCSDDFKAETSSFPCKELHKPVQTLGISGGGAVSEVVKNGVSIVLNSQGKRRKSMEHCVGGDHYVDDHKTSKCINCGDPFCLEHQGALKEFMPGYPMSCNKTECIKQVSSMNAKARARFNENYLEQIKSYPECLGEVSVIDESTGKVIMKKVYLTRASSSEDFLSTLCQWGHVYAKDAGDLGRYIIDAHSQEIRESSHATYIMTCSEGDERPDSYRSARFHASSYPKTTDE